jgi:hypothetical protein
MIRKFGFKNYFSFKEGAELSFEYDGNVPVSISKGKEIGTVIGIKGANGAGKTNLIKGLVFLSLFACVSAQTSTKDTIIPIYSFFDNEAETAFYIELEIDGIVYIYEITLTVKKVLRESIWRKRERKTLLIERFGDEVTKCVTDYEELKNIKLRSDASIISSIKNFKFKSEMVDLNLIFDHLGKVRSNVTLSGYRNIEEDMTLSEVSEAYNEDEDMFNFVKFLINKADNSIKEIHIFDRTNNEGKKEYFPIFFHAVSGQEIKHVSFNHESSGTKALFRSLYYYWRTLVTGGVLCMDEFDIHLHSLLLPDLLNLFLDDKINKNGAQLIFTAHITEVIDTLGKYRSVLVNKEDGESYCYRLDELPGGLVRNDRAISPIYLQGKIGGVPVKNG